MNYYDADKTSLICAALRRVEELDVALVAPDPAMSPEDRLRAALRRVADPGFPARAAEDAFNSLFLGRGLVALIVGAGAWRRTP